MLFRLPDPIVSRFALARNLGRIVSVIDIRPYTPNEGDDTYWTIDSGNDWKVTFYPDKPDQFRLTYRYNRPTNDVEAALAPWLMARFKAEPLSESSVAGSFAPKAVLP